LTFLTKSAILQESNSSFEELISMKILCFRIQKIWVWSLAFLLSFGIVLAPGIANANSHGQQIVIYYPDGGTTTLVSNGQDICQQVNNLSYASNCDYPSHIPGMGYVNGTHRVYANRNSGGSHQPVVAHPRPTAYPQIPQNTRYGDQIYITNHPYGARWIAREQGADVCSQIRRQFDRECLDYHDLRNGNHQVTLGSVLQTHPTSNQNHPTIFCVGGTGTDVSGAICIH
jgi:hypothetical protein